jgi:hypothetical protein
VSSFSPSDGQQSDGHVLLTLGPLDPHACACRVGQYPAGLTGYNLRTTPSHTGIQGHGQDRRTLLRTLFTSVTCTNRTDVETLHPSFRVRLPTSDRTHRFGLIISLGFERIPHVHGAHAVAGQSREQPHPGCAALFYEFVHDGWGIDNPVRAHETRNALDERLAIATIYERRQRPRKRSEISFSFLRSVDSRSRIFLSATRKTPRVDSNRPAFHINEIERANGLRLW